VERGPTDRWARGRMRRTHELELDRPGVGPCVRERECGEQPIGGRGPSLVVVGPVADLCPCQVHLEQY
jgi:hypothetical protein